jgi:hypothetical protein
MLNIRNWGDRIIVSMCANKGYLTYLTDDEDCTDQRSRVGITH